MRRIYAKPGDSCQWVFETTAFDIPENAVEMTEDRPAEDFICRSNFDDTGDWVRKKEKKTIIKFSKGLLDSVWLQIRASIRWMLWYSKQLRFRWITKNSGFSFIRSTSFVCNLFTSLDYRKGIDLVCFSAPLLIIESLSITNGVLYDILLATSAAAIFDAFITIIPREQAKRSDAHQIWRVLHGLVALKNHQYRMIGYLPDSFWLSEREFPNDRGMNREKANRLMRLMTENIDGIYAGSRPMLPLSPYINESNRAFFIRSHLYFAQELNKLIELTKPEIFPGFSQALMLVNNHLQNTPQMANFIDPQSYVTDHFKFIESLQLYYKIECHRYVGFEFDTPLLFDRHSVHDLMHIFPWYYAAPSEEAPN